MTGNFQNAKNLKNLISEYSGIYARNVTKNTTYLVATSEEFIKKTNKIKEAITLEIPIVREDFIHDSIKKGKLLGEASYLYKDTDDTEGESDVTTEVINTLLLILLKF